jgi:6-phosphogluconolactonase
MNKSIFFALAFFLFMNANAQKHYNLLVGTYTNSCQSEGIYIYNFNTENGTILPKGFSGKTINPSYLTTSADNRKIYSVNENGQQSTVSSFLYDAKAGTIDLLNQQNAQGADPCHIINDDKNVIVANYSGGNISVFGKNTDGSLTSAKQIIQHDGHSIKKQQQSPHVHQVNFSPDKKFVFANDLGTDRIYVYNYASDSADEVLRLKDTIATKTGSGPRHLTFSPNGKFVYLLQELDGTLSVFSYGDGKFKRIQETTVVANEAKGEPSAADIHLSPDGKFLYATNRGEANTISIFSVDSKGKLTLKKTMPTGGKGPRNFAIDPGGNYLLVAHQYTNDVIIFKRDQMTGLLENTGKKITLCAPVCLVFTE